MIEIVPYNETYIQIKTDKGVAMELKEEFSFFVPGYRHMPKFKFTPWTGKIYLFNAHKRTIYKGLLSHVIDYFKTNDYQYTIDESLIETEEISLFEAGKFCQSLDLPMDPYDYQVDAFCHAVRNNRALFLSPTSSGKSYIIYLITRFYEGRKLIIVPTKGLIKQMHTDFQQYSKGTYEGLDHEKKWKDGVISDSIVTTWQSIYKLPQEFFDQFDVIIGDEAHHFQANSLTSILENSPNCKYRFGFTGTLDGAKCFTKGTRIKTIDGEKNIENIQKNDKVITYNTTTEKLQVNKVVNLINNGKSKDKLLTIKTSKGSFTCTKEHKIYTSRGWIEAKNIQKNDKILSLN